MFDLHTHILPAFDDGAADHEVADEMLRIAQKHGTTHIVATPHVIKNHWFPAWEHVISTCEEINKNLFLSKLDITVYPGAEVFMDLELLDELKGPGPYCINNGRYMLVELPAAEIPRYADDFFFALQARGITPILAHPERHPEIAKNLAILQEWIRKGVLSQVNAPSLTGRMGERVMKTAELLVLNNMAHCIGSDAHGVKSRRPILSEAIVKLKTLIDPDRVHELIIENPQRILNSEDIDILEPQIQQKLEKASGLKSWITKIFG